MDWLQMLLAFLSDRSWGELACGAVVALAVLAGAGKAVSAVAVWVTGLAVDAGFAVRDWWRRPSRLARVEADLKAVRHRLGAPPGSGQILSVRTAVSAYGSGSEVTATFLCPSAADGHAVGRCLEQLAEANKPGGKSC